MLWHVKPIEIQWITSRNIPFQIYIPIVTKEILRMNHLGGEKVVAVLIKVSLEIMKQVCTNGKSFAKGKKIVQKVRELTRATRLRQ